jgi:carbon-monoxide dehydrogenase large subunit
VMGKASKEIVDKAGRIAAHLLEADRADLAFAEGRFTVNGTDSSVDLYAIAGAAESGDRLPEDLHGPLQAACDEIIPVAAFPFGAHVCEVEVDPDTGLVEIVRYSAVDDVGRAVNPMILHGQTHGAIVQGVGQALWEHCSYDAETGQLLSGSMMDYAMPRADMLPSFATELGETPAPSNPLGVRAGGEGGTTPALGAVANAVVDALAPFGVTHTELPITSEKVWRAMHGATTHAARAPSPSS